MCTRHSQTLPSHRAPQTSQKPRIIRSPFTFHKKHNQLVLIPKPLSLLINTAPTTSTGGRASGERCRPAVHHPRLARFGEATAHTPVGRRHCHDARRVSQLVSHNVPSYARAPSPLPPIHTDDAPPSPKTKQHPTHTQAANPRRPRPIAPRARRRIKHAVAIIFTTIITVSAARAATAGLRSRGPCSRSRTAVLKPRYVGLSRTYEPLQSGAGRAPLRHESSVSNAFLALPP
jgi:hypothetical protein